MPTFKYRELEPAPAARDSFLDWIQGLDTLFTERRSYECRSAIVALELHRLYKPHLAGAGALMQGAERLLDLCYDPRNITLEPEYYGDVDIARYNERKPLIYLWQMFDRSPLGLNQWLGSRFRAMLGKHIFRHLGRNVKFFQNVEFSFGYNLVIEDDCVIHRNVLLDDRGGLILRKGTSVSDYANIYSHTHDIEEQANVTNKLTEIGPGARITYHATVLAGTHVGEDSMLGTMGVATRDIEPHVVSVGVPAKAVRVKERGQQKDLADAARSRSTEKERDVSDVRSEAAIRGHARSERKRLPAAGFSAYNGRTPDENANHFNAERFETDASLAAQLIGTA